MTSSNRSPCRTIRDHFNLSVKGFALTLAVSEHAVLKWENGTRPMPPIAVRLADVLARVKAQSPALFDALTTAPAPAPAPAPKEALPSWL